MLFENSLPLQPHLEKCTLQQQSNGKSGNSSVGRAQPCQGWGRGSESRFPLNILKQQEFCFGYGVFENGEVAELVDALL